jgi:ribosomal protein L3
MALQAIVGEKVAMSQVWVNDKVVPVTVPATSLSSARKGVGG